MRWKAVATGMSLVMTSHLALGCSNETAPDKQENVGTHATGLQRSLEDVLPTAIELRGAGEAARAQIVETTVESNEDLTVLLRDARVRVFSVDGLRSLRFQFDDEPSLSQFELEALVQRDPARAAQFSLVRLALADRAVRTHESMTGTGLRPKWLIHALIGISIVVMVVGMTLPYVLPPAPHNPCGAGNPMPSTLTVTAGLCCTVSRSVQVCGTAPNYVEAGTNIPVSTDMCVPDASCYAQPGELAQPE